MGVYHEIPEIHAACDAAVTKFRAGEVARVSGLNAIAESLGASPAELNTALIAGTSVTDFSMALIGRTESRPVSACSDLDVIASRIAAA